MSIPPHAVWSFSATEVREEALAGVPLDGHGYIFSCTVIFLHPQIWRFLFAAQGKTVVGSPGVGFGG